MKYREVTKRLKRLNCEEVLPRKPGSHRIWWNLETDTEATIPDWGSKDLKTGTLHSALKKLGIDYKTFLNS
ncbi:type II toxin-antitoxin system HicA family toxin [Candidatus Poribacteria bacterium]|nr:type II toxin-antitoxin system HicA family toxin [Candidatus Poribacteria bacterium]